MSFDPDRGELPTERALEDALGLDRMDVLEAVALMQREDRRAVEATVSARNEIAAAVELVADRLASDGRLIYVGAGTSGRLGVLDAVECPPTFQSDPEQVQAILAGGEKALLRSVEGAEDDAGAGAAGVERLGVTARDVVFGITAGGTTAFVHGALDRARELGGATIFLACVPREAVPDGADVSIRLDTGPEVLAGSTRLKAGTATKLVLNTVTTLAMARLGKVHGNLMVDVNTTANRKLTDRGERLVMRIAGCDREAARAALRGAGGSVKGAVVMGTKGADAAAARERLESAGGILGNALES